MNKKQLSCLDNIEEYIKSLLNGRYGSEGLNRHCLKAMKEISKIREEERSGKNLSTNIINTTIDDIELIIERDEFIINLDSLYEGSSVIILNSEGNSKIDLNVEFGDTIITKNIYDDIDVYEFTRDDGLVMVEDGDTISSICKNVENNVYFTHSIFEL